MTHEPRTSEFAALDKLHDLDRARFQAVRDNDYSTLISKLNDLEISMRNSASADDSAPAKPSACDTTGGDPAEGDVDTAQSTATALDARARSAALNDVVLLESFFGNLGGDGGPASGRAAELIDRDFGSFDRFGNDLLAIANSANAYVATVVSLYDGTLLNVPIDAGHAPPTNSFVVLALSVDHVRYTAPADGDSKRKPSADPKAAFVGALLRNVNWSVVNARLDRLVRML